MAGFAYQAMGHSSAHSETALPENTTSHELSRKAMDFGDCLDLLTCVCYLLPCDDSVLHDEVDLPLSKTASTCEDTNSQSGDGVKEDEQGLIMGSMSDDAYDLTAIVGDPPMHFAPTDRQYGMCPLGYQETIYFKEAST